jgi:hypothetical protein
MTFRDRRTFMPVVDTTHQAVEKHNRPDIGRERRGGAA